MVKYIQITCVRSDGLREVHRGDVREANEPTTAQQQRTADKNNQVVCYQRIHPDDEKSLQWRRKLGGMLINLLGTPDQKGKLVASLPAASLMRTRQKLHPHRITRGLHTVGTRQIHRRSQDWRAGGQGGEPCR